MVKYRDRNKKMMNTKTPKKGILTILVLILVTLTLSFQGFHFFEHIVQLGHWIFNDRSFAYMTPWVMTWVEHLGMYYWPEASMKMQMHLGMELIHLIGNGIFFAGTLGLYVFVKNRASKWAIIIQGIHLYEHISLTLSAIAVGKSIGLSTFFGIAIDHYFLVGYRVLWHFTLNLIPSVLVIIAFIRMHQNKKLANNTNFEKVGELRNEIKKNSGETQ
jgi:hypothetical protein